MPTQVDDETPPASETLAAGEGGISEGTSAAAAEVPVNNGQDNNASADNNIINNNNNNSNVIETTTITADLSSNDGLRQGTISSARFNILCTMVGGGCLSLPFGFQKTGNALFAPFLLLITALITEYCFRIIVTSTRRLSPVNGNTSVIGTDSFESMASAAFGSHGFLFAKHLVTAMCFFGAVGYAVLLRDMLQPISDALANQYENRHDHHGNGTIPDGGGNGTIPDDGGNGTDIINGTSMMLMTSMYDTTMRLLLEDETIFQTQDEEAAADTSAGPTFFSNLTMLTVILLITPVCTLKNLSSLEKLGAASMSSILILGGCIVYRSLQCNMGHYSGDNYMTMYEDAPIFPAFKLFPDSWKDVLDAFPLFVSCYVCHYNIPAVHNELQNPTPKRVNYWLRSTTVSASIFYLVVGVAGSAYGHCTPTGKVQGNVLLDFDEDDPLLLIARMCLACTITLAFPLLVIPARDILLRSWFATSTTTTTVSVTITTDRSSAHQQPTTDQTAESSLREPLLADGDDNGEDPAEEHDIVTTRATATAAARSVVSQPQQHSLSLRLGTAILVLWSAAAVACCVKSIDVVWDFLGSSLSILLSYVIPCGSFIVIMGQSHAEEDAVDMDDDNDEENENGGNNRPWRRKGAILLAKAMLFVYIPLMFISTFNACYETFVK